MVINTEDVFRYLGYNEIETVEGLHTLTKLEELHVEHQRLQNGMSLTFDPKSLSTFCVSSQLSRFKFI